LEPSEVPPAIPRTWEMGYQWDMLEYIGIILGIGIYNDIYIVLGYPKIFRLTVFESTF
jgi:hypothetical protein